MAGMEAAAADLQRSDPTDVQEVMQFALHTRRLCELAVLDGQFGAVEVCRQQAILVVEEGAAANGQFALFEANAGPVAVGHACTSKLEVLDRDLAIAHDENGLALGVPAIGDQHRPSAHTPDRQSPLVQDGHIAAVLAAGHEDRVAITSLPHCIGQRRCLFPHAHGDAGGARRAAGQHQHDHEPHPGGSALTRALLQSARDDALNGKHVDQG